MIFANIKRLLQFGNMLLGDKQFGTDFSDILKNVQVEAQRSFFLFVLDWGIPVKTFKTTLQFTKNLANTVP